MAETGTGNVAQIVDTAASSAEGGKLCCSSHSSRQLTTSCPFHCHQAVLLAPAYSRPSLGGGLKLPASHATANAGCAVLVAAAAAPVLAPSAAVLTDEYLRVMNLKKSRHSSS